MTSQDLNSYLEDIEDELCVGGGGSGEAQGHMGSCGGLILVERQVGCSDPLTGLALPAENSPLGCQGNNSGLYLLNPLLSLLRLCCAEPS